MTSTSVGRRPRGQLMHHEATRRVAGSIQHVHAEANRITRIMQRHRTGSDFAEHDDRIGGRESRQERLQLLTEGYRFQHRLQGRHVLDAGVVHRRLRLKKLALETGNALLQQPALFPQGDGHIGRLYCRHEAVGQAEVKPSCVEPIVRLDCATLTDASVRLSNSGDNCASMSPAALVTVSARTTTTAPTH